MDQSIRKIRIDINIVNYVLNDWQFYAGQIWLTRHPSNFEILFDNWALTFLGNCKCACTDWARFSWDKGHQRRVSINFIKLNDTNTLATSWITTLPGRCDLPITCLDFPILRFHVYTLTIFLLANLSFVKTKSFQ